MKLSKKLLALVLSTALVLPLFACSGDSGSGSGSSPAPSSSGTASGGEGAAAGYPDHVITLLVNYSAGGGTDLSARALGDAVSKVLGGNITVTNLPGGTGTVGITQLANSDPDGYTIGVATLAPLGIAPHQLEVTYTPDSFKYICAFGQYGYGIVVAADSPYETLDDLIAAAKESPISFGATGYPQPITMADLGAETGAQFDFVQYPSTTDCVADVLGGFVPCALGDMASFASYVKSGDMRLLASAHSLRWEVAPDVPTLQEMGYEAICDSYMGICVPAETPDEIVTLLQDAFKTAFDDAAFQEIMANTNQAAVYLSGEEYEALVRETYEFYSTFDFTSNI